ncbi:GNAT family N-acetyltransferase [Romboutsia sp. CE17]|uniref:GNAT family N-acetyltransferase n=1 Tax=Romboutsia sp. CE17 TaxID=2724150 RepID=UPI001442D68E|nr:GNAT family N-acetyltransferase [Romboutsia sp. CE17]QJA08114.1 GNAT family N-acetyltransferase [Romboutsia sp. CE17]
MNLRKSTEHDVNSIMNIIQQAQEYFKENGIDQWQNGYPNHDTIKNDINNEESYVLVSNDDIIATASLSFNGEETYNVIYDGEWLSYDKYAVIHRVAVQSNCKGKGISGKVFDKLEKICLSNNIRSIKIDTHKDNISMQNLLKKCGFKQCGRILLTDNSERIAFEKLL